jgi:hypothetical protein
MTWIYWYSGTEDEPNVWSVAGRDKHGLFHTDSHHATLAAAMDRAVILNAAEK